MRRTRPLVFPALAITTGILLVLLGPLEAQTQASQHANPTSTQAQKAPHTRKRPGVAHLGASVPQTPPSNAPLAPETPKWPAFEDAAPPSVVWDSHGLTIAAANSSLQQILKDVSAATGVKVEGFASDQRVFGSFGPGQARDVLSQLLQGSGYNVMMIGDQGQGAPRQILLSARQGGPPQPVASSNQPSPDEDSEPDEQPSAPVPQEGIRPGFAPGAPPRSPQQIMQEMQQRQQQMQLPNSPPN